MPNSIKSINCLMKMGKLLLSILLITIFHVELKAQRTNGFLGKKSASNGTILFSIGAEYGFTDTKEPPLDQSLATNWDISLGFRQKLFQNFGYKALINTTNISGSDGIYSARSFSFSSRIWQMAVQAEYAINFKLNSKQSTQPNSIYLFLGAGLLNSSADLKYKASRSDYIYETRKNNQFAVSPFRPIGLGYQYDCGNNLSVGIEYNFKYTFSDYMDGFKPPQSSSRCNDSLEGLSFVVGYKIF